MNANENKKVFQKEWLSNIEYTDWLREDKTDKTNYRCFVCGVTSSLSTSGQGALTKHADGDKHKGNIKKRNKVQQ